MHGGDIYNNKITYDFSVNVNPYGPYESVLTAIKDTVSQVVAYPEYNVDSLRRKLSDVHGINHENIIITNGASEAICAVISAINPRRGYVEMPAFYGYERTLKSRNIECLFFDRDDVQIDVSEEDSVYFIASPSNPTGKLISIDKIKAIYETIKNSNSFLILDECFLPLSDGYKDSMIEEIKKDPDFYEHLIILRSFTKTFAIPGVRLGYIICTNKKLINSIRDILPEWNVSLFAINAGLACLDEVNRIPDDYEKIASERDRLTASLEKIGIEVIKSESIYIVIKTDYDLYNLLLDKGILIRNCEDYRGLGRGYFRIAVKKKEDNEILLDAIKEIIWKPADY
ncbi:MAG: histidinol-phosphate transaminase [Lachnospiraceae bacterium]|nr:histidinol-phosphate transaminase [Lachnospiraceae bacterium]